MNSLKKCRKNRKKFGDRIHFAEFRCAAKIENEFLPHFFGMCTLYTHYTYTVYTAKCN